MTNEIGAPAYLTAVTAAIDRVARTQTEGVRRAADLITAALDRGGVVQAFGCGHSEALSMEIAGRAGGLVPSNRIALRDLVLYGGADRSILEDPLLERDPTVAHRLYELAPVKPDDVFVLTSNSGVNGVIVEFALLVKEHGHPLIGITSSTTPPGSPRATRRGSGSPTSPTSYSTTGRRTATPPCPCPTAVPSGRSPRSPARCSPNRSSPRSSPGCSTPVPGHRSTCPRTYRAAGSATAS
ncbi:hypothetical protein GCM10027615_40310 [Plantactinospora veratri]